jgi:hypothetical protein
MMLDKFDPDQLEGYSINNGNKESIVDQGLNL